MVNGKILIVAHAFALCVAATLLLVGTAMGGVSKDGLVAEWHFDGDAKDSSGNGNDGILYGASFVDGKFGQAINLNDYRDVFYVTKDFSGTLQQGTIEIWFKLSKAFNKNSPIEYRALYVSGTETAQNCCFDAISFRTDLNTGQYGLSTDPKGKIVIVHGNTANAFASTQNSWDARIWYHLAYVWDQDTGSKKLYINGILDSSATIKTELINRGGTSIGGRADRVPSGTSGFYGTIDEVRIYKRVLSAEEIKEHYEQELTALTITKTASPYSIKQGQTTTVSLILKNIGITDILNIEVMDTIHPNFDLISGEFPNPKKYNIIRKSESLEIQYAIKAKESGTFNLDPVTVVYADKDGNIQEVKSKPYTVKVIPSFEDAVESKSSPRLSTSEVLLHGEKTEVVLGEDVLLKLSAVNLIVNPPMNVQVILNPPSGMSVTSSEFVKSGAGIYTTTFSLNPSEGKDIEVRIKTNQVGDFNVKGRIVYYFGDNKSSVEDHTLNLPIKVRKDGALAQNEGTPAQKQIPGFEVIIGISGLLLSMLLIRAISKLCLKN